MTLRRLHHVGYIVASISKVGERFANSISSDWDGQITHDPIQNVRVSFIESRTAGEASVELVEPVDSSSPVTAFLQRGGGLHHLCYEVADLDEELLRNRSSGCVLVKPPAPAAAFDGRRIAWVLTPDRLLVEYLESGL